MNDCNGKQGGVNRVAIYAERERIEPFTGKDDLWAQAYAVRREPMHERYKVLKEIAKIYAALGERPDDAWAKKWRRNLQENWTRLVYCRGAPLEVIARDVFEPRSEGYYKARAGELRARAKKGGIRDYDAQRGLELIRDMCEYLNTGATKKEARALSRVFGELKGEIVPLLRNCYLFGSPPDFEWELRLMNREEAEPRIRESIEKRSGKDRENLEFLLDERSPRAPSWYVFFDAKNAPKEVFAPVCVQQVDVTVQQKGIGGKRTEQATVRFPRVRCDTLEDQFTGLPAFLDGYVAALASFLRSPKFITRTGYEQVVLSGIYRKLPKKVENETGVQDIGPIFAQEGRGWVPLYALHLLNRGTPVLLNNRLRKPFQK